MAKNKGMYSIPGTGNSSNIGTDTGSTGGYNYWQDQMNKLRQRTYSMTGDATAPNEFDNGLGSQNYATNNIYGDKPLGFSAERRKAFYGKGGPGNMQTETPFSWSSAAGKAGEWLGDNPLEAADVGLRLWGGIQQNKALDQNEQYLGDVRQAMRFDQEDVKNRWNLAMSDYRVRQEDQNQFREESQGMKNKYATV